MNETKCRIMVRERSHGMCERCGVSPGREMHHRKNRSQGGKWHPGNITHLCSECHLWATVNPKRARETGWSVRGSLDPLLIPVERLDASWLAPRLVYLTDDGGLVAA